MAQQHMLDRVREKFTSLLNGYLPVPDVRDYIVTPAVAGNGSATLGNSFLLRALQNKNIKTVPTFSVGVFALVFICFLMENILPSFIGDARCWY